MSLTTILAGLKAAYETVPELVVVLSYVPRAIQTTPMLYSYLEGVSYDDTQTAADDGSGYVPHYQIQSRLVLPWIENEQAEVQLAHLIDDIVAAVTPKLGTLSDGHARIVSATSGWMESPLDSKITFRTCDFMCEVWEV